jgi:hypothetical protein
MSSFNESEMNEGVGREKHSFVYNEVLNANKAPTKSDQLAHYVKSSIINKSKI